MDNVHEKTHFALDWDNTFTRDMDYWCEVIKLGQKRGHKYTIITARFPEQTCEYSKLPKGVEIVYTSYRAKKRICESYNIKIDVWIDDTPDALIKDTEIYYG